MKEPEAHRGVIPELSWETRSETSDFAVDPELKLKIQSNSSLWYSVIVVSQKTDEMLCVLVNLTFQVIVYPAYYENGWNFLKKENNNKCKKPLLVLAFWDAASNVSLRHNVDETVSRGGDEVRAVKACCHVKIPARTRKHYWTAVCLSFLISNGSNDDAYSTGSLWAWRRQSAHSHKQRDGHAAGTQ